VRDLVIGDWVALSYDTDRAFPHGRVARGCFGVSAPYGSQKAVHVPEVLDERLALLLGMYASEGHTNKSTWTIVITKRLSRVS
jgi:hypothetical protein